MIGLIFGETSFPLEILNKIKRKKEKYLIIDLTKSKKFKKDKKSYPVSIGKLDSPKIKPIILLLWKRCTNRSFFVLCYKFNNLFY